MNRDDRLTRLIENAKAVAGRDAEKADTAEHERGWRRLELTRRKRPARWPYFFLAPALVATAVLLVMRLQDQKRLAGDLALEVRGGQMGPGGLVDVQSPLGATVMFSDGTEIDVDPDSDVRILDSARRHPLLRLETGRLTARLPTLRPAPFTIQAGTVRIQSAGGDFDIALASTMDTATGRVMVRTGQVFLLGLAPPTLVAAGQSRSLGGTSPRDPAPSPQQVGQGARPSGLTESSAAYLDPVHLGRALTLEPGASDPNLIPWRGWQATIAATRLRDGLGVTLGDLVIDERDAKWLAQAGFTHATVEFGWNHLDQANLARFHRGFADRRRVLLGRLRQAGIRPTVLLNAYAGPPARPTSLALSRPASRGDRQLSLDPASVPAVQVGYTRLGDGTEAFITSVSGDGSAVLSRPLLVDLPAGPHRASTFIYPPFRRPTLANGDADPLFAETLEGWVRYVRAATALARDALGDDDFDLEIWNIATAARDLFDVDRYYDPAPLDLGAGGPEAAILAMLNSAIAFIRDPANQLLHVQLTNGFANRRWHETVASQPPGVDAMGRHIVLRPETYFPEQPLFALNTDHLWRDLAATFAIAPTGAARLRDPEGPAVWVNSLALGLSRRQAALGLSASDVWHQKSRFALRAAAAYVGKGAGRLTFFHHDPAESLIDRNQADGGPVITTLGRFMTAMGPSGVITQPRSIFLAELTAPTGPSNSAFAFLPFQLSNNSFAIPVYQLTRSPLSRPIPGVTGPARFDAPPLRFRMRIAGVAGITQASLFDPTVPGATPIAVSIVEQKGDTILLEVEVSDTPKILRLWGK